jgi:hypothetical protein
LIGLKNVNSHFEQPYLAHKDSKKCLRLLSLGEDTPIDIAGHTGVDAANYLEFAQKQHYFEST